MPGILTTAKQYNTLTYSLQSGRWHFAILSNSKALALARSTNGMKANHYGSLPSKPKRLTQVNKPEVEIWIQPNDDGLECDVIISTRGRELTIRLPNYDRAVEWAHMEARAYGLHPVPKKPS